MESDIQYLEVQLLQVQRLSDELWHAMDRACRLVEGEAWLGPAADRFNDELHRGRNRLRGELSRAVDEAHQKVRAAREGAG